MSIYVKNKWYFLFVIIFFCNVFSIQSMAQEEINAIIAYSDGTVIKLTEKNRDIILGDKSSQTKDSFSAYGVNFNINYQDVDTGFNDPTLGPQRKATLQSALEYVANVLNVPGGVVDINISSVYLEGQYLASAGPIVAWYNPITPGINNGCVFQHLMNGSVDPDGPDYPDMQLTVNWNYTYNFGTGDPGPSDVDLLSVLIHEITHGLGFLKAIAYNNSECSGGTKPNGTGWTGAQPDIYTAFDTFLITGNNNYFINSSYYYIGQDNYFLGLDNGVYCSAPEATSLWGTMPRIYTPSPFQCGSSISHWNNLGGVMDPSIYYGAKKREYLPFEIALLRDIGYVNAGEPSSEGEGIAEGEGVTEGEGTAEGEGVIEGEGIGEGTADGEGMPEVIQINSIEELQKIGNDPLYPLNWKYELTHDIDASDTINWNDGAGFKPIGTQAEPFIGFLDGKGYKIINLYINRPDMNYVGLIGYLGDGSFDGKVWNLTLENYCIVGKEYVGGLVGRNYYFSSIKNCSTSGFLWGNYMVGGLVGENFLGIISNNHNSGSICGVSYVGGIVGTNSFGTLENSSGSGPVWGFYYVGGLAGASGDATVNQCYSTASVWGSGYSVGGLIGEINNSSGDVSNSYSTGYVLGGASTGGLVGRNSGSLLNCYSISSTGGYNYIGGLVGNNTGTISKCYSAGAVSGSVSVGGLVGKNTATVDSSYWDKDASGQASSSGGTGKTTAEMKQQVTYAGWDFTNIWTIEEGISYPYLIGLGTTQPNTPPFVEIQEIWTLEELSKIGLHPAYPWWGEYELKTDIDTSETIDWDDGKGFTPLMLTGKFHGNGHVIRNIYINRSADKYVGVLGRVGIGGEINDLGIEDCSIVANEYVGGLIGINYGAVNNCYATGSVKGYKSVGGLIGSTFYNTINNCYSTSSVEGTNINIGGFSGYNSGTINRCYSIGYVTGPSSSGGFLESNIGTVNSCYWDKLTSGRSSSSGGTGKTTVEMKRQTTYVGWDFVNTWNIVENCTYPFLTTFDYTEISPELTIIGESEITTQCGTEYIDAGATACDIPDGDLTNQIQVV
ncbi:MAG TPA: GLUG motif-containing protein, partial [Candidatus Hydrogenedens sp.]|nr:GLUG motif-containing protein [Candidatus Hydrogenedens sp.]